MFNVRSVVFMRLLLTTNSQTELAINTHVTTTNIHHEVMNTHNHVLGVRQDVEKTHTLISSVHHDVVNTHTLISGVQNDVVNTHTLVSGVHHDVLSTHAIVSDIHRNILQSREGSYSQDQAVGDTRALRHHEYMLTTSQTQNRSVISTTKRSSASRLFLAHPENHRLHHQGPASDATS